MFHGVSPPGGDFFEAVLLLSVLQCHGVLLFRNRPLEHRCGTVLRAWELHFGAGFLSVQKATLGSSLLARRRFRPSVPWCFAVSASRARTSLWSCFEAMGAALWSWFLVGSEVRHWSLLARRRFRPSVQWCFAVSASPARTSLWSCFEGMGAAVWSWFLVDSEGNVRQWSLLARRRCRPSVPWCFAVSESPARTSLWSCFEGMGAAVWSWFVVG